MEEIEAEFESPLNRLKKLWSTQLWFELPPALALIGFTVLSFRLFGVLDRFTIHIVLDTVPLVGIVLATAIQFKIATPSAFPTICRLEVAKAYFAAFLLLWLAWEATFGIADQFGPKPLWTIWTNPIARATVTCSFGFRYGVRPVLVDVRAD